MANRVVNRLGPSTALDLTEEEGASLAQVIAAFLVAERLLDLPKLWKEIEETALPEMVRVELFSIAANSVHNHLSDILRCVGAETSVSAMCKLLEPGVRKIAAATAKLIRAEVRNEAAARRERLISLGATDDIVKGLVRLYELDGVFGLAALAARKKLDELALARAYTKLGEALGIDWAQQQLARFMIGTVLGILYLSWKEKLNWLRIHDYVACCVPFGLFFGRLANFVNHGTRGAERRKGLRLPA